MSDTHSTFRATDNAAPPAHRNLAQGDLATNAQGQEGETLPRTLEITLEDMRGLFGLEEFETPHNAPETGDEQVRIREILRDPHRTPDKLIWHCTRITNNKEVAHV